MTDSLYYLQDTRQIVGNEMLWWAKKGEGYTTDLSKAEVYNESDAQRMHASRQTDVPWPKAYIDARSRPTVDFQYCRIAEALADTGIKIQKSERARAGLSNCAHCGGFISERQRHAGCQKCGGDNRT